MGRPLSQKQIAAGLLGLSAAACLAAAPVHAQDLEIPRTPTFPGIPSPAFPYAQPEEVGLSSEKLNRLGNETVEWVANGEMVGAELLIVKNGKAVLHEAYGWSDRERKIPAERNSIWSIKSMSKPVTATAVLLLAGTDPGEPFVFVGSSLHEELMLFVDAGVMPLEALRTATLHPAQYLEATDSLGPIAPGKLADLVLLEANPLEDIRNTRRIAAVVLNGRYLDRRALDALLARAEAEASRP